jgi:hypothetical protein
MLRRVDLLRTDESEERIATIIRVTEIGELRLLVTANVVSSSLILVTVKMDAIYSPETPLLTRASRCNIPADGILHSHRREHLKSYIALTGWTL